MVVLCLDTCDLCFCRYYFALFIVFGFAGFGCGFGFFGVGAWVISGVGNWVIFGVYFGGFPVFAAIL